MITERIAVRCDYCVNGWIIRAGDDEWSECPWCYTSMLRSETDEEMAERLDGEEDRRDLEMEARRRP